MATVKKKKTKDKNVPVLFNIPNAEMHEAARNCREAFIIDKADFVAWDADFDDPYSDDWLDLIEAAEAFVTEEALQDVLTELTVAVEVAMKNSRIKFQDSKYFIKKAFPNNKQRWNAFGFDNYNYAQRVQTRMLEFMGTFWTAADKFKTDLIAAGYAQPKIDEIATLRDELIAANQAQETFIGELPVQTRDRRNANNEVWKVFQKVCEVGKRLYKDDWAKYQRYLLPPGEESAAAISISGVVTLYNSLTSEYEPLQGALVEILTTGISHHTNSSGKYEIGSLPAGTYDMQISTPANGNQTFVVVVVVGERTIQDAQFN